MSIKGRSMNPEVLNSWKEIAAYLGRGVRTVQRWEQDLGLPVRRPRGKERSAVIALRADLNQWLQQSPHGTLERPTTRNTERRDKLHINAERLIQRTTEICERSAQMQAIIKATLGSTRQLRQQHRAHVQSNRLGVDKARAHAGHARARLRDGAGLAHANPKQSPASENRDDPSLCRPADYQSKKHSFPKVPSREGRQEPPPGTLVSAVQSRIKQSWGNKNQAG